MAALSEPKDEQPAAVFIAGISFLICLSFLLVTGILSWLRERASFEWWRDRCGCLGGSGNGTLPDFHSVHGMKPEITTPHQRNDFSRVEVQLHQGFDNPLFEPHPHRQTHGLNPPIVGQRVTIPKIDVTSASSEKYSSDYETQSSFRYDHRRLGGNNLGFVPPSPAGAEELERQKVVSKPSITSDYVSDVDSEYSHAFTRVPTGGRRSNRRMGEKKRHRRRHHTRSGTRLSQAKHKKHGSSMTNLTRIDLGKPLERSHSVAVEFQSVGLVITSPREPIPPGRNKRIRSASDAHLRQFKSPDQTTMNGRNQTGNSSFRKNYSSRSKGSATSDKRLGAVPQKSNSLNPLPTKSSGLVRSETILQLPIYLKPERPSSAHIPIPETEFKQHHRTSKTGKAARPKPPRTGRERKRTKHIESRSTRNWQDGYGSLPADLRKIKPSVLEQIGMTPESLVKSLEKLDFEKLCRPVPSITEDQRQASPRKPVVDSEMPGHEQELLKNTYKLENFDIVSTDL